SSIRSASGRFILPPGVGVEGTRRPRGAGARNGKLASLAQCLGGIAQGMEFHGRVTGIMQFGELAIKIGVIDFAGAGMMPAGNVGNVDKADEIDVFLELFDEVAFGNLLVEKIVEKFDVGIADGADDVQTFGGAGKKIFGIFFGVDVFDEQLDIVFGGDIGAALESLDAAGVHVSLGEPGDFVANLHDE